MYDSRHTWAGELRLSVVICGCSWISCGWLRAPSHSAVPSIGWEAAGNYISFCRPYHFNSSALWRGSMTWRYPGRSSKVASTVHSGTILQSCASTGPVHGKSWTLSYPSPSTSSLLPIRDDEQTMLAWYALRRTQRSCLCDATHAVLHASSIQWSDSAGLPAGTPAFASP